MYGKIAVKINATRYRSGGDGSDEGGNDEGGGGKRLDEETNIRVLALKLLAEKATGAFPGIIGSLIGWLFNTQSKATMWLASNLWAEVFAVAGLLYLLLREWIFSSKNYSTARPTTMPPIINAVFSLDDLSVLDALVLDVEEVDRLVVI